MGDIDGSRFIIEDFGLWGYSMYCEECARPNGADGEERSRSLAGATYSEDENSLTLSDLIRAADQHTREFHP